MKNFLCSTGALAGAVLAHCAPHGEAKLRAYLRSQAQLGNEDENDVDNRGLFH
jgi:hypothetical protein